jgi:hypothetical protein
MFKDIRDPLVVNGSALLSFGMNDFRIDEDVPTGRITVTMAKRADKLLILETIESMIAKLKDEVMGALLKYRILVVIWGEEEKINMVDIDKAREAIDKKTPRIRDIAQKQVETSEFKAWVIGDSTEEIQQISQKMIEGKANHVFLVYSSTSFSSEMINMLHKGLAGY